METPKVDKKNALMVDLDKSMSNSDFERATKICNRLLHASPDDELAFRCKIICCIQQNRITDALTFMDRNPRLLGNLGFEKAYCLYRNQDMAAAKEVLRRCPDSYRKQELMTQILYRLEEYDEAFESCREVMRMGTDEYNEERQTNLAAINACLMVSGQQRRLSRVEYDTHEMRYNMGCALIAEQRYEDALRILQESRHKAMEVLKEDGLTEEEIDEDTAIIRIQMSYCLQKLGREKDAMALYAKVLKNKPPENDLVAVASNNILCINKEQNIFDSKKRVKAMRAEGADAKLTRPQRRCMQFNQCLFYLHTGQSELCTEACTSIKAEFPEIDYEIILVEIALTLQTKGIQAAKIYAAQTCGKGVITDTLSLCFVQQLLRDGKRDDAIKILQELLANRYQPGIVGALVTLFHHSGKVDDAVGIVKQAVEFYQTGDGDKRRLNMLWRQAASLMLQQGDVAQAVMTLEQLRRVSPDDTKCLCHLILAYIQYDISRAHRLRSQLPPPPRSTNLDMAILESPNWLANVKLAKRNRAENDSPSTPQVSSASNEAKKKKKKKKCKSKQPKECDPNRQPDSERWLPKYERTGYRPKKSRTRGKVDVGKGTQGADSAASAIYDMSVKAKGSKSAPALMTTPSPNVGSSQQSRKAGRKSRSSRPT